MAKLPRPGATPKPAPVEPEGDPSADAGVDNATPADKVAEAAVDPVEDLQGATDAPEGDTVMAPDGTEVPEPSAPAEKVAEAPAATPAKKAPAKKAPAKAAAAPVVVPPRTGEPKRPAAKGNPRTAVAVAELDEEFEPINACYYGPEGTGKTTDLMFMANLGKILVVNAEAGIKVRRLRHLGVKIENIRVWPDPKLGEEITFKGLEDLFWQMKGDLLEDPDSWVGNVWDSVTEIHKVLLGHVVDTQYDKAIRAGKDRDEHFIDRADYGTMTEQLSQLLRKFRDLPCHFAMTALERRDVDDDGTVKYGPAVTPALITNIGGMVDILIHKRVDEGLDEDGQPIELYSAKTRQGGKYRAKDRWAATPPLMADPFFDRVVSYVREEITAADDPVQAYARESVGRLEAAEAARKAAGGKRRAA